MRRLLWKNLGINQKLIVTITAISLVIFSIIGVVDWYRIRQNLEDGFLANAFGTARGLEIALASGPRLPEDDSAFAAIQKALLNNADLLSVSVISPSGNAPTVILASDALLVGQPASRLAAEAYEKGTGLHEVKNATSSRQLAVAAPLFIARSARGAIELRFTLEGLNDAVRDQFAVDLLFLSFFILLLASSVYLAVRWFVIFPIWGVRDQINRFANTGELEIDLSDRGDEVGDLARKFQEMASTLLESNEKQSQLSRLEAIGQLTGGVAHDFNNLLAIIRGNAELLREHLDGETSKEFLAPVIRATERGSDLTHQLLAYARKQPLFPQEIDLGILGEGIAELLARTIGERIEIEWRNGHSLLAFADPGQFENALVNLAINARDAMPDGGKLTIEANETTLGPKDLIDDFEAKPGDFVVVRVMDEGSGMSTHVLERAFEPFFTTKGIGLGSGLGLSMVYGFVRQSKGQMTIESGAGQGTTVSLYLPKATRHDKDVPEPPTPERISKGETILLVEDEPSLRDLISKHLERDGFRVLQAPDGPIGLEILTGQEGVDLLLSDVVLPNAPNGMELYRQAKLSNPSLKCLLISGHAVAAADDDAFPSGVGLLKKPFGLTELSRRVLELLEST